MLPRPFGISYPFPLRLRLFAQTFISISLFLSVFQRRRLAFRYEYYPPKLPPRPLPLSKVALLFRFWLWENLCMRFMATWLVNKKNVAAPLENRIYLVHMWGKVEREAVGGVRGWACQGLRAKGSWKVAKATQHLLLRCKVMPQFIKLRCSLPPTLPPSLPFSFLIEIVKYLNYSYLAIVKYLNYLFGVCINLAIWFD